MKKKGFTLIELLGIILILGTIALIIVPAVNKTIKQARKDSFEASVNSIIRAMKTYAYDQEIATGKEYSKQVVDVTSGVLSFEGSTPREGKIGMTKDKEIVLEMNDGTWCARKLSGDTELQILKLSESGSCDGSTLMENLIPHKPTYEAPKSSDTHRGIVYLDPTDLNKYCTKTDAQANLNSNGTPTEIKTGCMKWYVFDIDGGTYKLILDHNTTARAIYNMNDQNASPNGQYSIKWELDNLISESNWAVTPRLISAEEIGEVIDAEEGVEYITSNTGYGLYLEGKNTYATSDENILPESYSGEYAWLLGYLNNSANYGGTPSDSNAYTYYSNTSGNTASGILEGYWTSSKVTSTDYSEIYMSNKGRLAPRTASNSSYGLRPVIEINSSILTTED